ncbi:MvaI/BcnI family restriction endonuclease [Parendozoicomonas sp. Alg238-R29]|uniref:MvaI/BcnI family restriction endonuclease n=1 Tax=Parendozoicomonas sp. Alg238-R29 TaxID=2993446 RepID=UPI00248D9667|nr:MvaI/BcnI family restriction endonuclease [Parendozoicomonas sp. Alg238-R29]
MLTPKEKSLQKTISPAKISRLRKSAKALKKQRQNAGDPDFSHAKALDEVSRNNGFPNWKAITAVQETKKQPVQITLLDTQKLPVSLTRPDNQKPPSQIIPTPLANKKILIQNGIEFSVFEATATGLKKSILDATQPVRSHFNLEGFHDYEIQGQGPGHKIIKQAYFVSPNKVVASKVSLYRPVTKRGDPRMWFRGLPSFMDAGHQAAILIKDDCAYLFNISQHDLHNSLVGNDVIGQHLTKYIDGHGSVAKELLGKLQRIAKNPIPALGKGDTAVGMAIEAALGVPANSSKQPDYKGIELKSGRGSKNRSTLFAQVADWTKSVCKSSRDILDQYGYERNGDRRLYCTINAKKPNTQGLSFDYNSETDELTEKHESGADVATWTGTLLRDRLLEKHRETFWIQARSEMIGDIEHFHLESVIHTRSPVLTQLMPLLDDGVVTMDHLIKRKGGETKVSEKGPLFKIDKKNLPLLFPEPVRYKLV